MHATTEQSRKSRAHDHPDRAIRVNIVNGLAHVHIGEHIAYIHDDGTVELTAGPNKGAFIDAHRVTDRNGDEVTGVTANKLRDLAYLARTGVADNLNFHLNLIGELLGSDMDDTDAYATTMTEASALYLEARRCRLTGVVPRLEKFIADRDAAALEAEPAAAPKMPEQSRRATTLHTIADGARQIDRLTDTADDELTDLIARRIDVHALIAAAYKACNTRHEVTLVDMLALYTADKDTDTIRRYAKYLEDAATTAATN